MDKAKVVNPKSQAVATVEKAETQFPARVKVQPVTLVDAGLEMTEIEGLPDSFRAGETLSGFPPSPRWNVPGQTLFGNFIIMRTEIGPNNSRLYEIAAFQGPNKDPLTVAVWGTSALDRLFDSAYPPIQTGDMVAITFLGEKPTQRGLNPVKLFALRIVRASGQKSKLHAS